MSTKSEQDNERAEAIAKLRELLPPGSTVHTIVRHVSRSGMQRTISAIIATQGTTRQTWQPEDISWLLARAGVGTFDRDQGGVKVGGAGMDMGWHTVYTLSRTLYPDGFGEKCLHCGERPGTEGGADAMRQAPCYSRPGGAKALGSVIPRREDAPGPHEFRGRNGDTSGWDNDGGYALTHRSL